jgi:hypothetical protein
MRTGSSPALLALLFFAACADHDPQLGYPGMSTRDPYYGGRPKAEPPPYAEQVRGSPKQDPETLVQRDGRPAGTVREGEEDDGQKRERLERESTQRGIVPDATSGGSDRPQTIRQRENLRSGGSMIGGGTVAPLR